MSFQIDTALVNAFKGNVELQFQQKGSRLRSTVRNESQNAEFDFYDRIGSTEAVENTTRHGDTPLISTPHDRRRCSTRDFDWADMIDRKDKIRLLSDPTSAYALNASYALGRKVDRVIIEAATGTAYTGKTGSTSVTFPAASEVAVDYVETGSTTNSNLTVGKLRRTQFLMESMPAGEVNGGAPVEPGEERYFVASASQKQALLRTTEVTSADFNTVKALVNGEINTFLGFTFVWLELLTKVGNIRDCLAYTRQGLLFASADEMMVDVGPRRDKRNSVQVYVSASFGATRMWEQRVLRVKCDESK